MSVGRSSRGQRSLLPTRRPVTRVGEVGENADRTTSLTFAVRMVRFGYAASRDCISRLYSLRSIWARGPWVCAQRQRGTFARRAIEYVHGLQALSSGSARETGSPRRLNQPETRFSSTPHSARQRDAPLTLPHSPSSASTSLTSVPLPIPVHQTSASSRASTTCSQLTPERRIAAQLADVVEPLGEQQRPRSSSRRRSSRLAPRMAAADDERLERGLAGRARRNFGRERARGRRRAASGRDRIECFPKCGSSEKGHRAADTGVRAGRKRRPISARELVSPLLFRNLH